MVKNKKMLTVEDLYKFCLETNFVKFSAKESGYQLAVQVPTTFEIDDTSDDNHRGMMKLKFRILHDGKNRNGSYVPHKAAVEAANTIADRPIMAAIHQLDDGSWDFKSHEMEIIKNDEGELETNYIEKQVGSFSSEKPFWEHDDELDKDYLCAYGYVAEEYTKTADIIRSKGWTKNSCELVIEEMTFNAKEKQLELNSFYLSASTLLGREDDGTEIGEGMLGSRADIADFSIEHNSVFSNNQVIELLSVLNEKIDNLNIEKNTSRKEDKPLKKKFEKDSEVEVENTPSVNFDGDDGTDTDNVDYYEEPGDGESADPTPDSDGDDDTPTDNGDDTPTDPSSDVTGDTPADPTSDVTDDTEDDAHVISDDDDDIKKKKYSMDCTVNIDGTQKTFSITLKDKLLALSTLINDTYGDDGTWYDVDADEDNKIVEFHDYWNNRHYRQSYAVKKGVYALKGDRIEVFAKYLSRDEIDNLEAMKANYSCIEQELSKYKAEPDKIAILKNECYSQISESEEFKHLCERDTYFSMTVDEVRESADKMLLEFAKGHELKFCKTAHSGFGKKEFASTYDNKNAGRYGNLLKK